MCIGIPMQVIRCEGLEALCQGQNAQEWVDVSLVGQQAHGTWLLIFLGAAREVMEPANAKQILDAVSAMQLIMQGENQIDHLFDDLIERGPQLPPHLQAQVDEQAQQNVQTKHANTHQTNRKIGADIDG